MSVTGKKSTSKEKKSKLLKEETVKVSLNENFQIPEDDIISDNLPIECAKKGDVLKLIRAFEPTSPYKESIQTQIQMRDDNGKSALDWSSIFGTAGVLSELIKRGVNINNVDNKGYSALHFASAWNRVDCVKILMTLGAQIELMTSNNESAMDIAKRYNNYEIIQILQIYESKQIFKEILMKKQIEFLTDEKSKVLSKEDKIQLTNFFKEKLDWLSKTDGSLIDFKDEEIKIQHFLEQYLTKINNSSSMISSKKK